MFKNILSFKFLKYCQWYNSKTEKRTLPAYQAARHQHDENFYIKYDIYKKEPGKNFPFKNFFLIFF